jgi:hypothetical protein
MPVTVPVAGSNALAVVMRTAPTPPPGLEDSPAGCWPALRILRAEQNAAEFFVENDRVTSRLSRLDAWAATHGNPLWPCDYAIGTGDAASRGSQAIAGRPIAESVVNYEPASGGLRAARSVRKHVTLDTADSVMPNTRPDVLSKNFQAPKPIAAPSETPAQLA